jgi:acyl-coenzyme A thioesterase PaaI-like protein
MQAHSLVAFNTATASANKIHDDAVARRFGFRGGLVPGVDVYAYLCHLPAAAWGLDWLQRGTMRARFHQPVYDGHRVEITSGGEGQLELRDEGGDLCADGTATLPNEAAAPPDPADWPDVDQVEDPPPASPEVLVPGTAFGLAPHGFRADRHGEYLTDVRETAPLYSAEGVAHPGWILRDANYVLSANVRLGPWIHVESIVQHHDVVRDGEEVTARALVTKEWEHKGHRFVELDVLHLGNLRPVARTTHTAIYKPRGA